MPKVLIVEDNSDNFTILNYAFKRAAYEVVWAKNGNEGVDLALTEEPALILMDIALPGIDGIEATRRIRASDAGKNIPIIAVTAHAMLGDRERITASGCIGYIEKPFDPITLVEQIHAIIERKRREDSDR